MVVIGDGIVKGIINKLLEMAFEYLADQKEWQTGMKSELQRLQDALPRIQAVVEAAESGEVEVKGPLRDWLRQLKDALYDAEDVFDELDYPRLQQLAEENSKGKGKMHALLSDSKRKAFRFVKRALKSDPALEALREVVKRLDEVASHVGEFLQLLSTASSQQLLQGQIHETRTRIQVAADNRETGSLLTESKVFGRDQQREELLGWLMTTSDLTIGDDGGDMKNISLASVIGHGGMGKTTIVQSVFGDQRTQSHFGIKIWVCVSNNFDVKALTKRLLESATGTRREAESLAVLQDALRKRLMSSNRPVLVVLDDAWNDGSVSDWERLLAPLRLGSPSGSKILLTTRMRTVAGVAKKALRGSNGELNKRFHLTGLPEADFLALLNWHAFAGTDPNDYMKLQHIGKKIAARLGGLPLAAKVVGSMLNANMREQYWETILKNSIFKFEEGERGIMSVLRLSYHHLSKHLRPCFAYCSVFPQDHEFDKDDLVYRWMAVGLVQQPSHNSSESAEDIGRCYFDDLLKRSFLEPRGSSERYIIHDLLHELAESVSAGECFRFEGDYISVKQIPKSVRHLYFNRVDINYINQLAAMDNLVNLRTLMVSRSCGELWRKILSSARHLRALDLGGWGGIPNEVSGLKHLRFLSVGSGLFQLPVFRNYNLQSFFLGHIYSRDCVQQSMKNLISLRHYEPSTFELNAVGKLPSLQELNFVVREESEFKIGELKDLNQLRKLKIVDLENVGSAEEARAAELHGKEHLRELVLEWWRSYKQETEVHQEVLDGLQPHSSLKDLIILCYGGTRPANWMKPELIKNLQYVRLEDCEKLEHLPPFGRLPYLKHLCLKRMPAIARLDCEGGFQQLEVLEIWNLENWEEWSGLNAWQGRCFPRLCELVIRCCLKLEVLPSLPLGLSQLDLANVGLTALPELFPWEGGCAPSACSSLSKVLISWCSRLRSAKGVLQHCRANLKYLEIKQCEQLVDLPENLTTSLCEVHLASYSRMASLPSQEVWASLASLRDLSITECDVLSSLEPLQALGHRLNRLVISACPKLVQNALTAPVPVTLLDENSAFAVDCLEIDEPLLLFTEPLRKLDSVQALVLRQCQLLVSMGKVEPWLLQNRNSLERLELRRVLSLQSLPAGFQLLSSLLYLHLEGARQLQSLPQLPLSLKMLQIDGCNETLRELCRKDGGVDWPNIKHIPSIHGLHWFR